jgi:hypothetical protein
MSPLFNIFYAMLYSAKSHVCSRLFANFTGIKNSTVITNYFSLQKLSNNYMDVKECQIDYIIHIFFFLCTCYILYSESMVLLSLATD